MDDKFIRKQFNRIAKREEKLMQAKGQNSPLQALTRKVEDKIPAGLQEKLELAFYKGFQLVFEKGGGLIEKTYDKEDLQLEHQMYHYSITALHSKKGFKRLKRQSDRRHLLNLGLTTLEGSGLGLLGIGLPDIPIFIGVLLKGIYETALHYGFVYDTPEEQYYILLLIEAALSGDEQGAEKNQQVDQLLVALQQGEKKTKADVEQQMQITAKALATDMLCIKFIQGLPLVGVIGGAANMVYDKKILDYAGVKYQKRYLLQFVDGKE